MNKATKIILGIIVIILIIWGISSATKKGGTPAANEPIKIGFIGPLTGDVAIYGENEKHAIEMAMDKLRMSDDFKNKQIDFIYEDGKCTGKDASTAAQKLINVDHVKFIMGGICSAETLGAAPIAEKAGVILMSAFSSAPAISQSGDYVFRISPSDTDAAKFDSTVLAGKYKKVAIISENTDYCQGLRAELTKRLAEKGVTVVSDEVYSSSVKDFRTIITKVKESNPEAVYYNPGTSPSIAALLLNQARELGLTAPAYFNFFMGNEETIKVAGKNAEGVIFSDGTGLTQSGKPLLDEYKKRYSISPANEFEFGAAYDRTIILLTAINSVGADPKKVKDYLYQMPDYDGVIGKYHFDQNGDITLIGYTSYIIKDGKKVPYTI